MVPTIVMRTSLSKGTKKSLGNSTTLIGSPDPQIRNDVFHLDNNNNYLLLCWEVAI